MMSKDDLDDNRLQEMMWDFLSDIPHDWSDKEFIEDVKRAFIKRRIDVRPVWGVAKISLKTCEELGIPTEKEVSEMNPYLLKNAILNLLHRRDMLVRKKKIEYSTGKNLDIKTIDDLAAYEDEEEEEEKPEENKGDVVDENIEKEIKELEKET